MLFCFLVAANACKCRFKLVAPRFAALLRPVWLVLLVCMLAVAHGSPCIDIESFASWQPPLTNFLRPPGHEAKPLALTILAVCLLTLFEYLLLMVLEQMPTEAPRLRSDSEAVILCLVTSPRYIYSAQLCLLCMVELPLEHLLGTDTWPESLNTLQNSTLVGSLT